MVQIGYSIDSGEFSWYSDETPETSTQRVIDGTPNMSPKNFDGWSKEKKCLKRRQEMQYLKEAKELLELKQSIKDLKNN